MLLVLLVMGVVLADQPMCVCKRLPALLEEALHHLPWTSSVGCLGSPAAAAAAAFGRCFCRCHESTKLAYTQARAAAGRALRGIAACSPARLPGTGSHTAQRLATHFLAAHALIMVSHPEPLSHGRLLGGSHKVGLSFCLPRAFQAAFSTIPAPSGLASYANRQLVKMALKVRRVWRTRARNHHHLSRKEGDSGVWHFAAPPPATCAGA
jgi:hypothetical protein